MKSSSNAIRACIIKFATELADELHDIFLADMIQAVADATKNRSKSTAKPITLARTKGAKRSPDELVEITKRLHLYVSKHAGQRIEQIAAAMDVSTKELNLPVKKLVAERKLHTKGQKRATTYFAKG